MSTLAAARTDLTARLAPVVPAIEYVPARPNPPVAVITPGSPYLDAGDAYGSHKLHLTVSLLVVPGDNDKITAALDDLVCAAVLALVAPPAGDGYAWDVTQVSTYYPYTANGATYLACDLAVTDTIRITEED